MQEVSSRAKIEASLGRWGKLVIRHRWLAIAGSLLLTALCIFQIQYLEVDNSTESFLHPDDPASILYRDFRAQFDRDDRIIVSIQSPESFSFAFLEKLRAFHEELESEIPYTEEITSLVNARYTRAEGDEVIIGDLMEEWPETEAELALLESRVLGNPLYETILISSDAQFTTVAIKPFTYSTEGEDEFDALDAGFEDEAADELVEEEAPALLSQGENVELIRAIESVMEGYEGSDFAMQIAGAPIVTDRINTRMFSDVTRFLSYSTVLIALILFVLFRRATAVLIPPMVVTFSVLATFGIMVFIGIPGSISLQILPSFLLTVGICDAVHILTIVDQRLNLGDSKEEAICYALEHSGLAVVMTSLTTAAGLASFITAGLAPVSHLGIIAPIGIMLALAYTLVLLPAILAVVPLKSQTSASNMGKAALTRALVRVGGFSTRNPKTVLLTFLMITLIAIGGITKVRFSHSVLMWFPENDSLRIASTLFNDHLGGASSLELILDTQEDQGLKDPEVLRKIDEAMTYAETYDDGQLFVGKAISIVDVVKEMNQALHENDPTHYTIPDDRALITQELLLFENSGSDDMEELVDSQYRFARMSLRAPLTDAMLYGPFLEKIKAGVEEILGDGIEVRVTGLLPLLTKTFSGVVISMARSYIIAIAIITPMMVLLIGNIRRGLLSMIPNLFPVVFVLGLMGFLDIPLDAGTVLVGAIIIGLAVDDTIHFMHKFQRYFEECGDVGLAVQRTLESTGTAIFFTTLVLSGGFFVFNFAYLKNGQNFGLLAGTATIIAFLADVLLAPALLALASGQAPRANNTGDLARD